VGLRHLTRLTGLRVLSLRGTSISDSGLAPLATLVRLEALDLSETVITDLGLAQLHSLPLLVELNVRGTKVTDRALEELQAAQPTLVIFGRPGHSGDAVPGGSYGSRINRGRIPQNGW
jgi:hypothetical protein